MKKLISIMLALMTTVILAACGSEIKAGDTITLKQFIVGQETKEDVDVYIEKIMAEDYDGVIENGVDGDIVFEDETIEVLKVEGDYALIEVLEGIEKGSVFWVDLEELTYALPSE